MSKLFKTRLFFQVVMATLVATLATVGIVAATTTIGTSINTGGTLTVTSTTATSTISTGGLAVGTNQFVVQQTSGYVGIGTTSPSEKLTIVGDLGLRNGSLWQPVYVSDENLVLDLPFSEGTGAVVYDHSSSGNDGTISGASWASGKYGNALSFNGTNNYVLVPSFNDNNSGTAITLSAWIKTSQADTWGVMSKTYEFYFGIVAGKVDIYMEGDTPSHVVGTSNVADNQWHYIAATYDHSNVKIYVDGILETTSPRSDTIWNYISSIEIGKSSLQGGYFNGSIDEVKIYNTGLSSAEIRTQYLQGNRPGLVVSDKFRVINTSAQELFRINSVGNVGIGTTTPAATLDIEGYMRLKKNTSQPVACSTANGGSLALNSLYYLCICNGSSWVYATSTQACAW